jgi:hypothetical protein
MPITIELGLADEERNQLGGILKCSPADLDATLESYAAAALEEYGRMFIGQRVFTRGADIQVYRLFLLIKGPFDNQIPDEQIVSDLFQTTANQNWTTPDFHGWITREDDDGLLVCEPAALRLP